MVTGPFPAEALAAHSVCTGPLWTWEAAGGRGLEYGLTKCLLNRTESCRKELKWLRNEHFPKSNSIENCFLFLLKVLPCSDMCVLCCSEASIVLVFQSSSSIENSQGGSKSWVFPRIGGVNGQGGLWIGSMSDQVGSMSELWGIHNSPEMSWK